MAREGRGPETLTAGASGDIGNRSMPRPAFPPVPRLLRAVRAVQARIRDRVTAAMRRRGGRLAGRVRRETAGDTIYAVDRISEEALVGLLERELAPLAPFRLVAEGFDGPEVRRVFPRGTPPASAAFTAVVDPVDGTRGLMYDKRSAWVLTGIAPRRADGAPARLADIVLAVQTEIPTTTQWCSRVLWAVRGRGARAVWEDVRTGRTGPLRLRPSAARGLEQGFATVSRFFPGGKEILARVEEELIEAVVGPVVPGRARVFEDQYISTGGQFHEIAAGRDRFVADLRGWLGGRLARRGRALGITCHPYDACTALIVGEAGGIVTDPRGRPLDAPLDTTAAVSWVAYANPAIRRKVEPVLRRLLNRHGLTGG
jgi:hypothetical protein